MKKSIKVVTQYFPPDQAATGQLVESLVKELSKPPQTPHSEQM